MENTSLRNLSVHLDTLNCWSNSWYSKESISYAYVEPSIQVDSRYDIVVSLSYGVGESGTSSLVLKADLQTYQTFEHLSQPYLKQMLAKIASTKGQNCLEMFCLFIGVHHTNQQLKRHFILSMAESQNFLIFKCLWLSWDTLWCHIRKNFVPYCHSPLPSCLSISSVAFGKFLSTQINILSAHLQPTAL